MRIAVCDDEMVQVQGNVDLIKKWSNKNHLVVNVDTYTSAEEFLFRWAEGHLYDLALFDIKMKDMTGMELAERIRKKDQEMQIIFVTGIVDHVFKGYDVSALNYLVKPYTEKSLFQTLDKAYSIFEKKKFCALMVLQEGQMIRVPFHEIVYMEIRGHYFEIHTVTMGEYKAKRKMDEMLSLLDKYLFIRCHRSYIINMIHVNKISRQDAILKDGKRIPVSQANVQAVTQLFLEYHYNSGMNKRG